MIARAITANGNGNCVELVLKYEDEPDVDANV